MQLNEALDLVAKDATDWQRLEIQLDGETKTVAVCMVDPLLRVQPTGATRPLFEGIQEKRLKEDDPQDQREEWLKRCSAPYYDLSSDQFAVFYGPSPIFVAELVWVDGGRALLPWPERRGEEYSGFDPVKQGMAAAITGWSTLREYATRAGVPV